MSEHAAVVRGRHLKSLASFLQERPGGMTALALLPPDWLPQVTDASGLDWLPVERNLVITRAVYDALGPAEADRFFRDHTLASFHGPILKTMVTSAVRILGLAPASLARWVPKAWHLIFRACGEWSLEEVTPGARQVTFTLGGLPAACAEDPVWLRSVARSLEAVLELARVRGVVALAPRPRGARQAVFQLRWSGGGDAAKPPLVP
ncbi:MAG: hypothetical protein IPO09_21500 [Anaeromyxobacter sp.]|nr:hypothetical protein [Anaeromyxobacter sp.]MBL0274661.1 hypothetical protein [Anaeromyxobacter sp.]